MVLRAASPARKMLALDRFDEFAILAAFIARLSEYHSTRRAFENRGSLAALMPEGLR